MSDAERGGEARTAAIAGRPSGRRRSDRVVAAGRAMQEAVDQALVAARTDRPVAISGPPGSGKEHLARAIHTWSERSAGPWVVVACTAVSDSLLGREIFGATQGPAGRPPERPDGALARAARGTLLVDALDRAPAALQAELLRAAAEGRYTREREHSPVPVAARLIFTSRQALATPGLAATPHHSIAVPALAERPEDILPLAAHFLRLAADEENVTPVGFTSDARQALLAEPWTGNVRELFERVRQALRLAGNGAISAEALLLAADGENVPSFKDAKRAFETRYVVGLLRRCGGNISRAARLAKKDRKDFYDVIRRTGVNPSEFR